MVEFEINLPAGEQGNSNFGQLERTLSDKLAGNPSEDSCICYTSDPKIVESVKNYFLSSYDFGVSVNPEEGKRYKIKFFASI